MTVDVTDREDLRDWLETQPREVVVTIAARGAMRVLPFLAKAEFDRRMAEKLVFPTFRATMFAWDAASFPDPEMGLRQAAGAAANAALYDYATNVDLYAAAAADDDDAYVYAYAAAFAAAADTVADTAAYAAAAAYAVDIDVAAKSSGRAFINSLLWESKKGSLPPDNIVKYWNELKSNLLALNQNWHVWTDWYEARLWPDKFPPPNQALELARAKIPEEIWEQGWQVVNPYIEGLIEEYEGTKKKTSIANLAASTSPMPILIDGKLDVCPNPEYDQPEEVDDLFELPIRQRSLIRSILSEIEDGKNTPGTIVSSLKEYDAELAARGVQPFLGVLKDHAAILYKGVEGSARDFDWCSEAAKEAFARFFDNNTQINQHFPLDEKREQQYALLEVDESALVGDALTKPVRDFLVAITAAYQEGDVTTQDYFQAVKAMEELAQVLSTMPEAIGRKPDEVSPLKRFFARFTGFVQKTMDVIKKSDGFLKSETLKKLWEAGQSIMENLKDFIS